MTTRGHYYGMGPQAVDALSGVPHPKSLMVKQRGGLVLADYSYGTRDRQRNW